MVEIVLIVLCVNISKRFRTAGEKGAWKYILGIWGTLLGALIIGAVLGVVLENPATIYVVMLIAYIISVCIAVSGMKAGKSFMEYHEKQKQEQEQKDRAKNEQLAAQVADLQGRLSEMQANAQQARQNQSNTASAPGSPADTFAGMGFKVMDFRSETEKQAEKQADAPLEEPLEKYANDIVDVFADYDGNSVTSDNAAKQKIKPIGEMLNNNEKQLRVFHRAKYIAQKRNIYISSSSMERFWEGCGGWRP
jgi:hypothetical protein